MFIDILDTDQFTYKMQVFCAEKAVKAIMLFLVLSLVICSSLAIPINNVNNENDQKLIGAAGAYAGQFPYQVSLRYSNNGGHFCGGSIISEEWILTSARCIIQKSASSISVVVGSIYLNVGGVSHSVLLLNPNSEYNPNLNLNDIGLIRINGRISYSDTVRPVSLSNDPSSVGLPLTVSGWGLSSYPSTVFPNTLQWITLTSINNQDCQFRLPGYQIYDTHICSDGRVGQGICEGDYGSPLVFGGQQHGISSWNLPCGRGFPDLYTRVSTFRDWIRAITNI